MFWDLHIVWIDRQRTHSAKRSTLQFHIWNCREAMPGCFLSTSALLLTQYSRESYIPGYGTPSLHLLLDQRLTLQSCTESQSLPLFLHSPQPQHQHSTGLCTETSDLHPVHMWLCQNPPRQHHHQIRRRHHLSRTHQWDGLQRGGPELVCWLQLYNLVLNTSKTKEVIVNYGKRKTDLQPICINGECVERVQCLKLLGVYMTADLQWSSNTSAVMKKAQQRLHLLRILRRINLKKELLTVFYRCSIESVLTYCISVWFSSCIVAHRKAL